MKSLFCGYKWETNLCFLHKDLNRNCQKFSFINSVVKDDKKYETNINN